MSLTAAAAITAGASLVGGLFGQSAEQRYNAREARRNREFQREERLAAQEFNLDMWNRNNEYNSMANVIQRARDAGVSAGAVVGDGSTAAQPVTTSPSQGSSTAPSPSIASSIMSTVQNADLLQAQVQNIKADTKGKDNENTFFTASFDDRLKALKLGNDKLSKEGQEVQANIDKITTETSFLGKYYDLTARSTESQIAERSQNILNLQNQYRLISKEIDKMQADIDYTDSLTIGQDKENAFMQLKLDLSNTLGFPTGTPEFEQAWILLKENKLHELNVLLLKKAELALSNNQDAITNLANQASLNASIKAYEAKQAKRESQRKYWYDENGMDKRDWKRLTEQEARMRYLMYGGYRTHRNP